MSNKPSSYSMARAHVTMAAEHLKYTPEQTADLISKFEIAVRIEPGHGNIYYTTPDGYPLLDATDNWQPASTAAWLRSVMGTPTDSVKEAQTEKPAAQDFSGLSMTAVMIAGRRGDTAALAELDRRTRAIASSKSQNASTEKPRKNTSDLWKNAKNGDPIALKKLNKYLGLN